MKRRIVPPKKPASLLPLAAMPQWQPLVFKMNCQNFTNLVNTSLCCGFSDIANCTTVSPFCMHSRGGFVWFRSRHRDIVFILPLSRKYAHSRFSSASGKGGSYPGSTEAITSTAQYTPEMLFLDASIIFDGNQETVSDQKFYQSIFYNVELVIYIALNVCIQHDGCSSCSSVYPTRPEQWVVFQA